jgi:phosphopantetheinyl transferase
MPPACLWLARCDPETRSAWQKAAASLFQETEQRRFRQLSRPERRGQFATGRVLLRHALGAWFACSSSAWRVAERPGESPVLEPPPPRPISFSIAHSRELVACLVAEGGAVGVDVEYTRRPRDWPAIARHAFHPQNASELAILPGQDQPDRFYTLWTLHEAAYKAFGNWKTRARPACREEWPRVERVAFATAHLPDYCMAIALAGFVEAPFSLRWLHPDGRWSSVDVAWTGHALKSRTADTGFSPCFVPPGPVSCGRSGRGLL